MKPLLLVALLAAHVSGATITTLVEARSGDETCVSDSHCEVFFGDTSVGAYSVVEPGLLTIAAWFTGRSETGPMFARTLASFEDSYLPPANGTATLGFTYNGSGEMDNKVIPRAVFNDAPLSMAPDIHRFMVPVMAGVPFNYAIVLDASTLYGGAEGRPRLYHFDVTVHEIAFAHAPEPATGSIAFVALIGLLLAHRLKRTATAP